MTISGFTFLRNASKLNYPFKESILSILGLVDEFIVTLGNCDPDDNTLETLKEINSDKIKIYHTKWDLNTYGGGSIYAHQTDLAKEKCSGDWLIYLQGDELIHEGDIYNIKSAIDTYGQHPNVEGFVLDFFHFYGDYEHYFRDHTWYKKEIRIIKNLPEIHSWRDAQSFRWIPDFNGNDYFRKKNTRRLNCVVIPAKIFHYGWVRPPMSMTSKNVVAHYNYNKSIQDHPKEYFDYGRIDRCKVFTGTHPALMKDLLERIYWKHLLRHSGPIAVNRALMKHERWKYRALIYIEDKILGGRTIGGFNNFKILNLK